MSISDFIIHFITILITEMILIYNFSQISCIKLPIKAKTFIVLGILSIAAFINNFYSPIFLRYYISLFNTFVATTIIYKYSIKEGVINTLIHSIIYIILELLLSPVMLINFESVSMFNNEVFYKSLFSILIAIFSIFVFNSKSIKNYISKLKILVNKKYTILTTIIITIMIINVILVVRGIETNNIYLIIASLNFVVYIIIIARIIINDKYNISLLNEKNNNLKDSYKAYSKTIDDCKEFKHNLKNELYSIKTLLPKEHQEKLNLIVKKYNTNYEWIDKIDEIPDGLQGLIYLKKKEALNKKINIVINTTGKIETNSIDYIDLSNVIGILLDNAIEASIKTKSKIIEVLINNTKDGINIDIINKYNNMIDLTKIGKKNYSTKVYKSGIGLNYINNIKNSHIKIDYKIINDLFKTSIYYSK